MTTDAIYRGHYAACPNCGRDIDTYVPKKGDGTVRYFRTHVCGEVHRYRSEVPGWQMNSVQRDEGTEVKRNKEKR